MAKAVKALFGYPYRRISRQPVRRTLSSKTRIAIVRLLLCVRFGDSCHQERAVATSPTVSPTTHARRPRHTSLDPNPITGSGTHPRVPMTPALHAKAGPWSLPSDPSLVPRGPRSEVPRMFPRWTNPFRRGAGDKAGHYCRQTMESQRDSGRNDSDNASLKRPAVMTSRLQAMKTRQEPWNVSKLLLAM